MSTEFICKSCGCTENVIETSDGEFYCNDYVAEAGYEYCDNCDTWHPEDEMNEVKIRYGYKRVCRECCENDNDFYFCEDCNEWFHEDYRSSVEVDGKTICSDCYDRNYVTCDECGEVILYDDAYEVDDDNYLCADCAEKRKNVKCYSYKPAPNCKRKEHGEPVEFYMPEECKDLLFGVELEIDWGDNKYECADKLCKTHEDIYIKKDGSLSDDSGMEIVTHPCTLEYHMDDLGWDSICSIAKRFGYRSHDTRCCGMHIHVGKAQLGDNDKERENTIAKIVMLVDRHWEQMRVFSRRTRSQLEEWATAPDLHFERLRPCEKHAIEIALKHKEHSRYTAVNRTNRNTIEFRLFNGSLKPDTIIAALQLVSNICLYAKNNSVQQCLFSRWEDIKTFCYYPELNAYCKNRGMTEVENTPYIRLSLEPETLEGAPDEGDRVFVRSSYGSEPYFIGQKGTVIEIRWNGYQHIAYVKFDNNFCNSLYNPNGTITSNRGYAIPVTELTRTI